jgi:hydrogenase maturation protease
MLVIGYGNPLRADDRVGWAVAEAVRLAQPDVSVRTAHALTPELAGAIAESDLVVFVDARVGDEPGRVDVERLRGAPAPATSPHGLTPAVLLAWAAALYGRHPHAYLVSVVGERYEFGETLSPAVDASIATVVETISHLRDRGPTPPDPTPPAC